MSMLLIVFVALIFWTGLYVGLVLSFPKEKYEWHCRIVTSAHAILVVAMSGWSVVILGPWPFYDPALPNTQLEEFTCAISFGYFLFDFLWCVYFCTEGPVMLFHHVLTMFGDSYVLYRGSHGGEMLATLFGTEITNPLLQLRWFIRQNPDLASSSLATAVDMAFLALFTFMRIILASGMLYLYLLHPRPEMIPRCGGVLIYLIGWFFWIAIVRYAWRKYVVRKPHKSESHAVNAVRLASDPSPVVQKMVDGNFAGGDAFGCSRRKENASSLDSKAETKNGLDHQTVVGINGDRKNL